MAKTPTAELTQGAAVHFRPFNALVSMVVGYAIVGTFSVMLHDWAAVASPLPLGLDHGFGKDAWVGQFLLVYVLVFVLAVRVADAGYHNLYEMLWACNVAMVLAGYGILTDRPRLVGASWVMVSLDQTLWYIEVIVRVIRGSNHPKRWLIGVAKYLDAPETTRAKFWTAWHHLWFSPLILWALRNHGFVPSGSYPLQVVLMTMLGAVSRALTPYQVYEPKLGPNHVVYLNINLSHKFWRDIHTRNWGTIDRLFASRCGEHNGVVGVGGCRDDFAHIYDNAPGLAGAIRYLLWTNLILNIVNIGPTLGISFLLWL